MAVPPRQRDHHSPMALQKREQQVAGTAARAFWIGAVIIWGLLEVSRARRRMRAWFS